MPQTFKGSHKTGSSNQSSSTLQPGGRNRMLADLVGSTLLSQLTHPPAPNIPQPLGAAIGGLESILPQLFGNAFGANKGVAGMLGPNPAGSAAPTFGPAMDRSALGLTTPTLDPGGFLPPTADVKAAQPRTRVPVERASERKLDRRVSNLTAQRDDRVAGGQAKTPWLDKRIKQASGKRDRLDNNPKYLESNQ